MHDWRKGGNKKAFHRLPAGDSMESFFNRVGPFN